MGAHTLLPSRWQLPIRVGTVIFLVMVLLGGIVSIVSPSLFQWASSEARGEVIIDPGDHNPPGDLLSLSS